MNISNKINIVVIQEKFTSDIRKNLVTLKNHITKIRINVPTIIVLHELSLSKYFCICKNKKNFNFSINDKSFVMKEIKDICTKEKIFILFSYFEGTNNKYYNTTSLVSPQGSILLKYRKKNIPNELCYHESYYFQPSTNPFKIIDIGVCKIGLMLCWDQWYSDSYFHLCKLGAEIILCPTSIGNTYVNKKKITLSNEKKMWTNVIQANSLMNNIPVVIANRIGKETDGIKSIFFWGSSFITNSDGKVVAKTSSKKGFLKKTINLLDRKKSIKKWGFIKNKIFFSRY